jgi:hypothetical protein
MKIDVTPAQLAAIKHIKDDIHAMIGTDCEETNKIWAQKVMLINRMLKKNGLAN